MTESSFDFIHGEDYGRIYTNSKRTARSIKRRLEKRDAEWEYSEYQSDYGSWGSWEFTVHKDDLRSINKIIKA